MSEFQLQLENHWMKVLHTVYSYGLNEETKFMNKDTALGKLFLPLSRYIECFIDTYGECFIDIEQDLK